MDAVQFVQEKMFIKDVESEKPLILKLDEKGAVDVINNWNIGGTTSHVTMKINI
jgi:hypothetical protein